jgi:acyl carrier protein
MIDVQKLLYEIGEDKRVYEEGTDLIETGILDSYVFIELFSRLEDYGIVLHPTRIDRTKLRTIKGIQELIEGKQHSGETNI